MTGAFLHENAPDVVAGNNCYGNLALVTVIEAIRLVGSLLVTRED